MKHEPKGILVEIHVICAARNVCGSGIYWDVLMSRGAEVRAMQGFRGGSDAVDVSAIAWSWRVSTLCVVLMGLRVIGVSIVLMGFGSMWSQCGR